MIMADIVKWLLIFTGLILTVISYWLIAIALMPSAVDRSRIYIGSHPIRAVFLGAVVTIPLMLVGGVLANDSSLPPVKILGFAFLFSPAFMGLLGSSGIAQRVGLGLPAPQDDAQPWRRVMRGGAVLTLAYLLPFVGWFLLLASLLAGVGGFVHAVARRPKSVVPPTEPQALSEATIA